MYGKESKQTDQNCTENVEFNFIRNNLLYMCVCTITLMLINTCACIMYNYNLYIHANLYISIKAKKQRKETYLLFLISLAN